MERIDSEWLAYTKAVINEYIPNIDRYKYKPRNQMLENELSKEFFNSNRLKRELRSKLKQRYESNWKIKMQESSKLEFYRTLKQEYKFKNYHQIKDRKHKAALTKLRISAHKLHIETGRYKKYDKDLKKYTNIPKDERRCQTCPNEVEDEYHFLFKCQRNLALRRECLNQMESIESGFKNKKSKEKVLALFASKNSKVINLFAKYVFQSFSTKV